MSDPKAIAQSILGPIQWTCEFAGYCHCPGRSLHSSQTSAKDCQVRLDGAPTVFCFHKSCQPVLDQVNYRLRRALSGEGSWTLTLPGGKVLTSGDHVRPDGSVLPRSAPQAQALHRPQDPQSKTIEAVSRRFLPELLRQFVWTRASIIASSPTPTSTLSPREMFSLWLQLWPETATIWIGDIRDSGKPQHAANFRTVAQWDESGPGTAQFTCPSQFEPGCHTRSNQTVTKRQFLVVESDDLGKDEIGAVFRYLHLRLKYRLHCIIDTAGKSLHGWFDVPPDPVQTEHLRAALTGFQCDPKLFTPSQPVRLAGALREGKTQQLLWIRE